MSLSSVLNVARSAIFAHQTAAEVTAHNIANAQTEGYTRQRANLVTGMPSTMTFGSIGTGVFVNGVSRVRQQSLDLNYREQAAGLDESSTRRDTLTEVQGIFGEPQAQGLANGLDAFWSSWSDLANNPGNAAAQSVVRQNGANVASTLNQFSTRLNDVQNGTGASLQTSVSQVNDLAKRIAALNGQISSAESDGHEAPDLRDQRDMATDQLAKLTGARALPQANGTYSIVIGGTTLVDATNARAMAVNQSSSGWTVTVGSSPDPTRGIGGSMGGELTVVNSDLPQLRVKLDALAKGLVNGVNFLHEQGWTAAGDALGNANWVPANGATGSRVDFFDASHTTAATISLSAAVQADAGVIASGVTQNGPGDNSLALQVGSLRDATGMSALASQMGSAFSSQVGFTAGVSYGDQYRGTVTQLGLDVSSVTNDATASAALTTQAFQRRESVSGVSMDEELTQLMQHQQAYAAASRIVNVVDEMMQTLLAMK